MHINNSASSGALCSFLVSPAKKYITKMCRKNDKEIERIGNVYLTKVNKNKYDQSIQNNKWQGENADQELFTLSHLRRKRASTEMEKPEYQIIIKILFQTISSENVWNSVLQDIPQTCTSSIPTDPCLTCSLLQRIQNSFTNAEPRIVKTEM